MTWLISKALMNSLSSQEQVEEFLEDTSLDGEQSVQSNGNPTQLAYCAPDKMTGFSRLSRYGMMYKPLTENLGEALLMSYLEVFHAKTSLPQVKEPESKENALECGEKWRGSFVKWDPDSSLWRTHQCSLLGDLEPFSETWPQWGLMRNGECWEQRTLEQTIRGTGYGFVEKLPTPTASDYKNQPTSASWKAKGAINYKLSNPEIQAKWPTQTATDYMGAKQNGIESRNGRYVRTSLTTGVKFGAKLTDAVNLEMKTKFPTPKLSDYKDRGNMSNPSIQRRAAKGKQMDLSMVAHPTSGQLNPDWVEWLMNWPIKWSELNGFNKNEFGRWAQESATLIQSFGEMRTMWWDSDPSQTPLRSQPIKQSEIKHSDSLSDLSWETTRQREMERSHQGKDLSVLRNAIHIQKSEGENLQSGVWEQTGMDEAQIIPRVGQSIVARMERIKAIGNGQVPLCAASAWRILK